MRACVCVPDAPLLRRDPVSMCSEFSPFRLAEFLLENTVHPAMHSTHSGFSIKIETRIDNTPLLVCSVTCVRERGGRDPLDLEKKKRVEALGQGLQETGGTCRVLQTATWIFFVVFVLLNSLPSPSRLLFDPGFISASVSFLLTRQKEEEEDANGGPRVTNRLFFSACFYWLPCAY